MRQPQLWKSFSESTVVSTRKKALPATEPKIAPVCTRLP